MSSDAQRRQMRRGLSGLAKGFLRTCELLRWALEGDLISPVLIWVHTQVGEPLPMMSGSNGRANVIELSIVSCTMSTVISPL